MYMHNTNTGVTRILVWGNIGLIGQVRVEFYYNNMDSNTMNYDSDT